MSRQRIAFTLAGLALVTGLITAPAATATPSGRPTSRAAAPCSAWKTITITGGRATYRECRKTEDGKQQVKGDLQLWDTKTDGKSVQAYARTDYNHWYGDKVTWEHFYAWSNTGRPSPVYSSGWHRGDDFELTINLV
ncbi:hypothetical protein [Streptomyces sp. TLI_105]|uniref:hypothetical protein n=1 Tax=Streptomyces sp. TLI_105 TaxID=1881019 RepID=UPI000894F94D|nr:hypothetical protein [Streptomyces sp. TLI_105]SEB60303.1 hypothetical protein SAMN05428939_0153 [Streptomyces sp. TLI_105]